MIRSTIAALLFVALFPARALAAEPERQQCIDAHSQGQDLRDKGKIIEARDAFLLCAQSSCPSLVQADCAQFSAEVSRLVPSVSFVARSADGKDLPATRVYVDDALVAERLDTGATRDINPGKHQLRFVNDGREVRQELIVAQGEKGRPVIVTFAAPTATAAPVASAPAPARVPAPVAPDPSGPPREPSRSFTPMVVTIVGGALLVTGASLLIYGRSQLPDACSLSSHQCVAAPGASEFSDARSSARTMNLGFALGGAGAAAAAGGLLWYFLQPSGPSTTSQAIVPWLPRSGGGLLLHRSF